MTTLARKHAIRMSSIRSKQMRTPEAPKSPVDIDWKLCRRSYSLDVPTFRRQVGGYYASAQPFQERTFEKTTPHHVENN